LPRTSCVEIRVKQALVAERMAATMSMPQAQLGLIRLRRGPAALQDFPDGTARSDGKIKAKISLGPANARSAAEGHDPIEDQVDTDYLREPLGPRPDVLDKYVGAASLIARTVSPDRGYSRLHELSARPTMGQQMMSEVFDDHAS
jgi:hypothetical protein